MKLLQTDRHMSVYDFQVLSQPITDHAYTGPLEETTIPKKAIQHI